MARKRPYKAGEKVYHASQRMGPSTKPFTVVARYVRMKGYGLDDYLIQCGNITMLVNGFELTSATGSEGSEG